MKIKHLLLTSLLTGIFLAPSPTCAEERAPLGAVRIENRWLELAWQPATGELQVRTRDEARSFFTSRDMLPVATQASVITVAHEQFGKGGNQHART